MDITKRDNGLDTCQSFTNTRVLGQKPSGNIPLSNQIQESTAELVIKKADLKEAKLKNANLLAKIAQQEVRIGQIQIALDRELQRESEVNPSVERTKSEIQTSKLDIQEFMKDIKNMKADLADLLEGIIKQKSKKSEGQKVCEQLQQLIENQQIQNQTIESQTQDLQTLIISSQNDNRAKTEELVELQLQKTEITTLLDYLQEKQLMLIKAKNSANAQSADLSAEITKCEQKLHNIHKETNESDFSYQQIENQNIQIEELNEKLAADLESVRKHLQTVQKMNKLLKGSLQEFGYTGQKVTRMIQGVKICE